MSARGSTRSGTGTVVEEGILPELALVPRPLERDLGPQPLARLLERHELSHHDLVALSDEQLTHKMVARGCKGRWLTANVRGKLLRALNRATGRSYAMGELFDYV